MTTFQDLGLMPELLATLSATGYSEPTPIQAQAIPPVLAGRDLLGIAQTGTGKTAAFALPILQRLSQDKRPAPRKGSRALILSPTRELASQIAESFKTYGRGLGFGIDVVFGGVSHRPQMSSLTRGLDILVATPGRLLDHMSEGTYSPSATEVLVLDEADQMLDLGFIVPLRRIFRQLPAQRQNLFFSATMPKEIGQLADELLRSPEKVQVTPVAKTADRVEQKIIYVEASKKRSLLVELMADPALSRALVFTRTKRGADKVARHLEAAGITASALHGNKSQRQRELALAGFKASKVRALVATDIAARGIDIDLVTHVINFELPNVPEAYVHRIGRTARAGAEGIAISLVDGEERAYLRDIERLTRQTIPSEDRRGDDKLEAVTRRDERGSPRDDDEGRGRSGRGDRGNSRFARTGRGERPQRSEGNGQRGERSAGESRGERPRSADPRREDRPRQQQDSRPSARRDDRSRPQSESRSGERRDERPRPQADGRGGERREGRPNGHSSGPNGAARDQDRRPRFTDRFRDERRDDRDRKPEGREPARSTGSGWPFSDAPQGGRPEHGRSGHDRRERFERGEGYAAAPSRNGHDERGGRPDRGHRGRPGSSSGAGGGGRGGPGRGSAQGQRDGGRGQGQGRGHGAPQGRRRERD